MVLPNKPLKPGDPGYADQFRVTTTKTTDQADNAKVINNGLVSQGLPMPGSTGGQQIISNPNIRAAGYGSQPQNPVKFSPGTPTWYKERVLGGGKTLLDMMSMSPEQFYKAAAKPGPTNPYNYWLLDNASLPDYAEKNGILLQYINQPYEKYAVANNDMGYWENPTRIARYNAMIKNAPKSWTPPEWLDTDLVATANNYLSIQNQGKPWWQWKALPEDDPVNVFLRDNTQMPAYEALMPSEFKLVSPADSVKNNIIPDYNKMLGWQKVALTLFSPTAMQNRPEWTRGAFGSAALAGVGTAALGGAVAGTPGAVIGFLAGAGSALYTNYTGKTIPVLSDLMTVFNIPAQTAEQIIGMTAQIIDSDWNTVMSKENIDEAWEAAKMTYESTGQNLILNTLAVPSVIAGKGEFAEKGETWNLEKGYSTPQMIRGAMGAQALAEARSAMVAGEDPYTVYAEIVDRFGFSGTINDFVYQSVLDPLNLAPFLEGRAGTVIGKVVEANAPAGSATAVAAGRIADAFKRTTGKAWIDVLPIGVQQLVEAVAKKIDPTIQGSSGAIGAFREYQSNIRGGEFPPGMTPIAPKDLSGFEKLVGDLTPEGTLKNLQPLSKTGIAAIPEMLKSLKPEAKAFAMNDIVNKYVSAMFMTTDSPIELATIIGKAGSMTPKEAGKLGEIFMNSPELATVAGALRDFAKTGKLDTFVLQYESAAAQRSVLELIAKATGETTGKVIEDFVKDPDAMATRLNTNPQAQAIFKQLGSPKVTVEALTEQLGVFTRKGADYIPFDVRELKANMAMALSEHMEGWLVDRLGIKPDKWYVRLSNSMKSVMALMMLNSPTYPLNNLVNNIPTRAAQGVFGFMTSSQINKFNEAWGINSSRLSGSNEVVSHMAGEPGGKPGSKIMEAMETTDILSRVQGLVKKTRPLQVFVNLSGKIENSEGRAATAIGTIKMWNTLWQKGKGFSAMPANVEAALDRAGPGIKDAIYNAVRAGLNMDQITASLFEGAITKDVSTYIQEAAEKFYPGNADIGVELFKTGMIDMELKSLLENAKTPAHIEAAFELVKDRIQDTIDLTIGSQLQARGMEAEALVKDNGWPAAMELFGDAQARIMERWLQHYEKAHDLAEAALDVSYEQASAMWRKFNKEESRAWERINAFELQTLAGIIKGLKMENQESQAFISRTRMLQDSWRAFFDGYDIDTRTKQRIHPGNTVDSQYVRHQDGKNDILRKYHETNYETKAARRIARDKAFSQIKELADAQQEYARNMQGEIDLLFAGMFEEHTGKPAQDALVWRQNVENIRDQMFSNMDMHQESILGITDPVRRNQAWDEFTKNIYNDMIIQLKGTEIQGAKDLASGRKVTGTTPDAKPGETPATITRAMQQKLNQLGYDDAAIKAMDPAQAWEIVKRSQPATPEAAQRMSQAIDEKAIEDQVQADIAQATILSEAEVAQAQGEAAAAAVMNKSIYREMMKQAGQSQDVIDAVMTLYDLRADQWAKANGLEPGTKATRDAWYASTFKLFTNDHFRPSEQERARNRHFQYADPTAPIAKSWYYSKMVRAIEEAMPDKFEEITTPEEVLVPGRTIKGNTVEIPKGPTDMAIGETRQDGGYTWTRLEENKWRKSSADQVLEAKIKPAETITSFKQLEDFLKNAGVKEDELRWTGMRSWIDGFKKAGREDFVITKQDLLDALERNEIRPVEVEITRSGNFNGDMAWQKQAKLEAAHMPDIWEMYMEMYNDNKMDDMPEMKPFKSLSLEERKSFLDTFVELPEVITESQIDAYNEGVPMWEAKRQAYSTGDPGGAITRRPQYRQDTYAPEYMNYQTIEGDNYATWTFHMGNEYKSDMGIGSDFTAPHFRTGGLGRDLLLHMRTNDIVIEPTATNGLTRPLVILNVLEVQSDWAQSIEKKGAMTDELKIKNKQISDRLDELYDEGDILRDYRTKYENAVIYEHKYQQQLSELERAEKFYKKVQKEYFSTPIETKEQAVAYKEKIMGHISRLEKHYKKANEELANSNHLVQQERQRLAMGMQGISDAIGNLSMAMFDQVILTLESGEEYPVPDINKIVNKIFYDKNQAKVRMNEETMSKKGLESDAFAYVSQKHPTITKGATIEEGRTFEFVNQAWASIKNEGDVIKEELAEMAKLIPDQPFSKNYVDVAIKNAIYNAAMMGYDGITMTNADMQYRQWGSEQFAWEPAATAGPERLDNATMMETDNLGVQFNIVQQDGTSFRLGGIGGAVPLTDGARFSRLMDEIYSRFPEDTGNALMTKIEDFINNPDIPIGDHFIVRADADGQFQGTTVDHDIQIIKLEPIGQTVGLGDFQVNTVSSNHPNVSTFRDGRETMMNDNTRNSIIEAIEYDMPLPRTPRTQDLYDEMMMQLDLFREGHADKIRIQWPGRDTGETMYVELKSDTKPSPIAPDDSLYISLPTQQFDDQGGELPGLPVIRKVSKTDVFKLLNAIEEETGWSKDSIQDYNSPDDIEAALQAGKSFQLEGAGGETINIGVPDQTKVYKFGGLSQYGGFTDNVGDLQAMAAQRGLLRDEMGYFTSKEDLMQLIRKSASDEMGENPKSIENAADRIMRYIEKGQESGAYLPRYEGMKGFYDKKARNKMTEIGEQYSLKKTTFEVPSAFNNKDGQVTATLDALTFNEDPAIKRDILMRGFPLYQNPDGTRYTGAQFLQKLKDTGFISTGDVLEILGAKNRPQYLDGVVNFLTEQRKKLIAGQMTNRDIAKAMILNASSQRAAEITLDTFKAKMEEAGLDFRIPNEYLITKNGKKYIRPEDAMSAWMMSEGGRTALDAIENGRYAAETMDQAVAVRKAFGSNTLENNNVIGIPAAGKYNLTNIDELTSAINEIATRLQTDPEATNELSALISKVNRASGAKEGFLKHMLGMGDSPTIDSVEINLWLTGKGKGSNMDTVAGQLIKEMNSQQNLLNRKEVVQYLKNNIRERMWELRSMGAGADLPADAFAHVMHHWLWDQAKGTMTTHEGMYDAIRLAQQDGIEPKGSTEFDALGRAVVTLFEKGDISTIVHETGHVFRRQLKGEDLDAIAKWGGLQDSGELLKLQRQYDNRTISDADYKRYEDMEEKFAKGWERHLAEANDAVPPALKAVFVKFTNLIKDIYKTVVQKLGLAGTDSEIFGNTSLGSVDINDVVTTTSGQQMKIRDVMNRLLFDDETTNIRRDKAETMAKAPTGTTSKTFMVSDPTRVIPLRHKLVELDALLVSHTIDYKPTPAYPKELQNKFIMADSNKAQVEGYAKNLAVEALLTPTSEFDRGSVIVDKSGTVISGNHRTMGLRLAAFLQNGQYDKYRALLQQQLPMFGFQPGDADGMKHPVIVRMVDDPNLDIISLVRDSNESGKAGLLPIEQAKQDAELINDAWMGIEVPDGKPLKAAFDYANNESARSLIAGFIEGKTDTELRDIIGENGELTDKGATRLVNALLFKTYGSLDGQRMIDLLTNENIQLPAGMENIKKALLASLGEISAMEANIRTGAQEQTYSITGDIEKAVLKLYELKQTGNMSVVDYVNSMELEGDALNPFQKQLLAIINKNLRSYGRLRQFFGDYAKAVGALPVADQMALIPKATKGEVMDGVVKKLLPDANANFADAEGAIQAGLQESVTPDYATTEGLTKESILLTKHGDYYANERYVKNNREIAIIPHDFKGKDVITGKGVAHVLGLDPVDPDVWVYEINGQILKSGKTKKNGQPLYQMPEVNPNADPQREIWRIAAQFNLAGVDQNGSPTGAFSTGANMRLIYYIKKWGTTADKGKIKTFADITPEILARSISREQAFYAAQGQFNGVEPGKPASVIPTEANVEAPVSLPGQAESAPSQEIAPGGPMGDAPTADLPRNQYDGLPIEEIARRDLEPMFNSIRDAMKADLNKPKMTIPADAMDGVKQWLNEVRTEMAATKLQATRYGETQRDAAMLNYQAKTGMDDFANMVFPFQFWATRSMKEWAMRMIDRPAWFALYARYRQAQKKMETWGIPNRLKGKSRIPAAYLPDWMGGALWTDPMRSLLPFDSFGQPLEDLARNKQTVARQAEQNLYAMLEDKSITQKELDEALNSHTGPLWEKAYAQAMTDTAEETSDPMNLMSIVMSPAMWISNPYYLATGQAEKISPLPITKTAMAYDTALEDTILAPLGKLVGMAAWPEKKVREALGISIFGQWGEYYIDRQLANMATEEQYGPEAAMKAMMERTGPVYDEALKRTRQEVSLKTPGVAQIFAMKDGLGSFVKSLLSIFPASLLPEGELKLRNLQGEYNQAWIDLKAGNADAIDEFFTAHPEYRARIMSTGDPETRLKNHLVNIIWDGYNELDKPNKSQATNALGANFVQTFLNSDTRDYSAISIPELSLWATMLKKDVPTTEETSIVTQAPSAMIPNIELYNNQEVQAITTYQEQKKKLYPYISLLQEKYFSIPEDQKAARRGFLKQFPELGEYWDWKKQYTAQNPLLKNYMANIKEQFADQEGESGEGPINVSQMDPILVLQLLAYVYAGQPLGEGANAAITTAYKDTKTSMSKEQFIEALLNSLQQPTR